MDNNPKWKTSTCRYWANNGKCRYSAENCKFLHSHVPAGITPRPLDKSRLPLGSWRREEGKENEERESGGEFVSAEADDGPDLGWGARAARWINVDILDTESRESPCQAYEPPHIKPSEDMA